jgi:hypothetical protein
VKDNFAAAFADTSVHQADMDGILPRVRFQGTSPVRDKPRQRVRANTLVIRTDAHEVVNESEVGPLNAWPSPRPWGRCWSRCNEQPDQFRQP